MSCTLKVSLVLSLLTYTILSADAAQSPPPPKKHYSPSDVFLCSPLHNVEVDFAALYLQPTGSYLHYAAEADPLPAPTPNWKIHEIHTDYHFGFDLGLKGIIHKTHSNLHLNWEHFHSTDSSSKSLPSSDMIGPFFEIGPDASPYNRAHGHAAFHFDQVNFGYGVFVHFGSRLKTTLFGDVAYARIKQTLKSTFKNPDGSIKRHIETPSLFQGAGPRFGLDFAYRVIRGLQFTGAFAADFFVGTLKNHTSYKSYSPLLGSLGITPPNTQKTDVPHRTQLIPGFEGSLGIAYSQPFRKHYLFKIEAGYEGQVYLNAIQSADIGSEVVTPPVSPDTVGVYARTFQRSLSNFALAGPYASISLGF